MKPTGKIILQNSSILTAFRWFAKWVCKLSELITLPFVNSAVSSTLDGIWTRTSWWLEAELIQPQPCDLLLWIPPLNSHLPSICNKNGWMNKRSVYCIILGILQVSFCPDLDKICSENCLSGFKMHYIPDLNWCTSNFCVYLACGTNLILWLF